MNIGATKADDVKSFLGTDGKNLTIVDANEMGTADFTELTSALKGMDAGRVDITLFYQTTLPDDAFKSCNTINYSISAPKATSIGKRSFYMCRYLTSVNQPWRSF